MIDLGALILDIFRRLQVALSQGEKPTRAYDAKLGLVYHRWSRTMARLRTLWHRWTTNTLPKKRPSQAGKQRKPRPPRPEGTPAYPSGHRWLKRDWRINGAGQWLLHNLNTPEFQAFITAVPQAARLIRPVLKTLEIPAPAYMALPERPKNLNAGKPRPKKPRFKRDPMPPKPRGGWVARNKILDIAGYPKFIVTPRLDTS